MRALSGLLSRFSVTGLLLVGLAGRVLGAEAVDDAQAARDRTVVQTLLRLDGFDLATSEKAQAAAGRFLAANRGSEEYFTLIEKYQIREMADDLLALAIEHFDGNRGAQAARLLLELGEGKQLAKVLERGDTEQAQKIARVLGLVGSSEAVELLFPLVADLDKSLAVRSAAVAAIGSNLNGQERLLEIVRAGQLPQDLNFTAANVLLTSPKEGIRTEAGKYLALPVAAGQKPLPPVAELARHSGDVGHGLELFKGKATCLKCHKLGGEGKDIGPDLSEIGSKLSKEALYVSILDPSAGISHNYETYLVALDDGNVVSGIKVSETADSITIKTVEDVVKQIDKSSIDEIVKQKTSLMPADLQKVLSEDELIDLVEYLTTLKKQGS